MTVRDWFNENFGALWNKREEVDMACTDKNCCPTGAYGSCPGTPCTELNVCGSFCNGACQPKQDIREAPVFDDVDLLATARKALNQNRYGAAIDQILEYLEDAEDEAICGGDVCEGEGCCVTEDPHAELRAILHEAVDAAVDAGKLEVNHHVNTEGFHLMPGEYVTVGYHHTVTIDWYEAKTP